jgi:hypothetical protein
MVSIPLPTYSKLITDQVITTEEHNTGVVFSCRSNRTQSFNPRPLQRHKTSSLLKEVVSDQLESIIQAGLGVGDSNSSDSPSVSLNLSLKEAHGEKSTNPEAHSPR